MRYSLKQKLGALLIDAPRYLYWLKLHPGTSGWIRVKNRQDKLLNTTKISGVQVLDAEWTSTLHLANVFPWFGKLLLKKALADSPIFLQESPKPTTEGLPGVSFIIGHRGDERLPLLKRTLKSIAAQQDVNVECIVVEQDITPKIKDTLPNWITYVFQQTPDEATPYSRAQAFNAGLQHSNHEAIIFHDNDLLIPGQYAHQCLKYLNKGYDFVNLKRFIFYLTKQAFETVDADQLKAESLELAFVMQNAQGGGSIAATRSSYRNIGGFDDRFVGWGSEDNEFWERANTKRVWSYAHLPLVHLWHTSQAEKENITDSLPRKLYDTLRSTTPADRIKHLTQGNSQ